MGGGPVRGDLEILARELKDIAEEGYLPDGDGVTVPVMLWAEGWLLTFAQVGISPAPSPPLNQSP
jgi:hypothetical protein